ncbi:MAG TPA: DUF167 domain-containing protein [Albitalea sp.]|nr:DUF167 domain-containing protein [Albitalea sp.]
MTTSKRSTDPTPPRWPCVRPAPDGAVLDVSVVPGAKRTELIGLHDEALRLRLAAPPIEGRANDALVAWLSGELGVARRSIQLLRGASGRRKQLLLPCSPAQLEAWLDTRCPRA